MMAKTAYDYESLGLLYLNLCIGSPHLFTRINDSFFFLVSHLNTGLLVLDTTPDSSSSAWHSTQSAALNFEAKHITETEPHASHKPTEGTSPFAFYRVFLCQLFIFLCMSSGVYVFFL